MTPRGSPLGCRRHSRHTLHVGWSPHPRVRASRGQRNAVAASHSSCLPTLALWPLLLLRRVKATRCAGARRRWRPSRIWVLVIRCSRQLLRKMSQRSKRTRRLVAPSPSCPDASPSHGPSLRTARANLAPSGGPVIIARRGRSALLEPFHNTGLRPGRTGLEPVHSGDHSDGHGPWDAGQQGQEQLAQIPRSVVSISSQSPTWRLVITLGSRLCVGALPFSLLGSTRTIHPACLRLSAAVPSAAPSPSL